MDPRLLRYYNRELQHVREMGSEFAKEFPKIAARLGLEGIDCSDPYVERLLEGFAFLAARVQLKLDAEFPRFTQHLLEIVYPHYLAPTPSMTVVQLHPDPKEGTLTGGFPVPRGTVLESLTGPSDQTACEYRTAHEVTLWPIEISGAGYFTSTLEMATYDLPSSMAAKAGIKLRVRTTREIPFEKLPIESLTFFLRGREGIPHRILEQIVGNSVGVVIRPAKRDPEWREIIGPEEIHRVGFADEEALLPYGERSFHGYRLLHEYFTFPERFLFVRLDGLSPALRRAKTGEVEIAFLFDREDEMLEPALDESHFALFCTPAINLMERRTDRIHLDRKQSEFHVVVDRTRPLDFEVYEILEVTGFGSSADREQEFRPFYSSTDRTHHGEEQAYYAVQRVPRMLSSKQRRKGPRSSYVGSEVYISLVDANHAPYRSDLRQLALKTLCTNRDLPLQMPVGRGGTDFEIREGAPVASVRCVAGPTRPRPSPAEGGTAWRLISHLSLNYLSLADTDAREGAAGLRGLLSLYGDLSEAAVRKQIDGLLSVRAAPIHRLIRTPGPITFGRGLEVEVTFDETAFEGSGVFLLGAVLEQFFARYVSINSFTETVVKTLERGEVIRWPMRTGQRHTL